MSTSAQRAALEAINSARPLVARLGGTRSSEDAAADLIESWSAVETGLRSLIGGSALSGQMLIRELRQKAKNHPATKPVAIPHSRPMMLPTHVTV